MTTEKEIRQNAIDETWAVLNAVYGLITPGTPIEYKTVALAEQLGYTHGRAEDRCQTLQNLGILTRTINYGRPDATGVWKVGRFAMWDLHMAKTEAIAKVEAWVKQYEAGEVMLPRTPRQKVKRAEKREKDLTEFRNQPRVAPGGPIERVIVAKDPTEDVRAVAGPEAESPMAALRPLRKADDATALIAAARQYAVRADKITSVVQDLVATAKSMGIEVDEGALRLGITLPTDERLETISLVLPVIDTLEARVESLNQQVLAQKGKVREYDAMTVEVRRLKVRVEALVSERVNTQTQAAQRAQA